MSVDGICGRDQLYPAFSVGAEDFQRIKKFPRGGCTVIYLNEVDVH